MNSELAQLVPLPVSRGRSTCYCNILHDFTVTIPRCYKDAYVNSFFPSTAAVSYLGSALEFSAYKCFPLTNDLSGFKGIVK